MLKKLSLAMRKLYAWVLSFADKPSGAWALFLIAFAESSFFPIPPDVLLIALAVAAPGKAFWYAAICSVGSVLGGILGYIIGIQFFDTVGQAIVRFYSAEEHYARVQELYQQYDAFAVAVAGLTPIPYKVATITAGFFGVDFGRFVLASAVSRTARFMLVAGFIWFFGPQIKAFIDKYFEILLIVFLVLLVGGFVVIRWVAS